jgi:hypothetical protein
VVLKTGVQVPRVHYQIAIANTTGIRGILLVYGALQFALAAYFRNPSGASRSSVRSASAQNWLAFLQPMWIIIA